MKRLDLAVKNWLGGQFYGHIRRSDFSAATLVVATLSISLWRAGLFDDLGCFLKTDGVGIYGALLSTWAALLGFAITAITIVSALVSTPQFEKFRYSKHYDAFWFAFTWTIRTLGAAAVIALVALFVNHYEDGRLAVFMLVVWTIVLAASSLLRSGLTLEELLRQSRELEFKNRPVLKPSSNPPVEP